MATTDVIPHPSCPDLFRASTFLPASSAPLIARCHKTWMPGTSPGMTTCFDRIVLALIFTVVAQAVTEYCLLAFGVEAGSVEAAAAWGPALSVTVAVLLGLGASCLSNTDALHGLLRRARVTRETSHPTEWYSTFARYGESCCVVLHLQGERRLYGFAEEWPGNPQGAYIPECP